MQKTVARAYARTDNTVNNNSCIYANVSIYL